MPSGSEPRRGCAAAPVVGAVACVAARRAARRVRARLVRDRALDGGDDEAAAADDRRRRRSRSGSSSRRASRATQMASASARSTKIAQREAASVTPKLGAQAYLAATRARRRGSSACFGRSAHARGLPLPGDLRLLARRRPSTQLVASSSRRSARTGRRSTSRYARSKNLTPYDVLIIASMVEKETLAPEERQLVAAVIYNRLHARMPLGIDATLRYGLHIPPTESIRQSQLETDNPYNTRKPRRACRRRRSRTPASPRSRRPRTRRRSTTSTSCASPTRCTTSSRRARRVRQLHGAHGYG